MASTTTKTTKANTKPKASKADQPETPEALAVRKANELSAAESLLHQRQIELEEATELVKEISAADNRGANEYTDDESIAADKKVERLSKWAKASELSVRRLKSEQVSLDIRLAVGLQPAVEAALHGLVPVSAVIGSEVRPGGSHDIPIPSVRITQEKPTSDQRGILNGSAVVSYYRNEIFSRLDDEAVEKEAKQIGLTFSDGFLSTTPHGGGVIVDKLKVRVHGFDTLPVIVELAGNDEVDAFVHRVRSAIVFATDIKATSTYASPSALKATADIESVEASDTEMDGKRTTTISASIRFTPYPHGGEQADWHAGQSIPSMVSHALGKLVGEPARGLGKVTTMLADTEPSTSHLGVQRVTVTATIEAATL
jgi:hypothetical protein